MRRPRVALFIGFLAFGATACAVPVLPHILDIHDPQSCAEDAMRRPSGAAASRPPRRRRPISVGSKSVSQWP